MLLRTELQCKKSQISFFCVGGGGGGVSCYQTDGTMWITAFRIWNLRNRIKHYYIKHEGWFIHEKVFSLFMANSYALTEFSLIKSLPDYMSMLSTSSEYKGIWTRGFIPQLVFIHLDIYLIKRVSTDNASLAFHALPGVSLNHCN